jgi:hypothetical protein
MPLTSTVRARSRAASRMSDTHERNPIDEEDKRGDRSERDERRVEEKREGDI